VAVYNDCPGISTEFKMGVCERAIISEDSTLLQRSEKSPLVAKRIEEIKKQKGSQKRIANLNASAACIFVGGTSTSEIGERYARVVDALGAVKTGLEKGYVAGGGCTFTYISKLFKKNYPNAPVGYKLLLDAIEEPFLQIRENGGVRREVGVDTINIYGKVLNIRTHKWEHMNDSGLIDSKKVLEVALKNAVSVSTLVLSTRVIVTT